MWVEGRMPHPMAMRWPSKDENCLELWARWAPKSAKMKVPYAPSWPCPIYLDEASPSPCKVPTAIAKRMRSNWNSGNVIFTPNTWKIVQSMYPWREIWPQVLSFYFIWISYFIHSLVCICHRLSFSIFRHLQRFDISKFQSMNFGCLGELAVNTRLPVPVNTQQLNQYNLSLLLLSLLLLLL